jgi:hypothetical protein
MGLRPRSQSDLYPERGYYLIKLQVGASVASIVKEIDDTPLPENESEELLAALPGILFTLRTKIEELEKQVMNLEQRKVANENNQLDPEWY